jgi:hypothetical protein
VSYIYWNCWWIFCFRSAKEINHELVNAYIFNIPSTCYVPFLRNGRHWVSHLNVNVFNSILLLSLPWKDLVHSSIIWIQSCPSRRQLTILFFLRMKFCLTTMSYFLFVRRPIERIFYWQRVIYKLLSLVHNFSNKFLH